MIDSVRSVYGLKAFIVCALQCVLEGVWSKMPVLGWGDSYKSLCVVTALQLSNLAHYKDFKKV